MVFIVSRLWVRQQNLSSILVEEGDTINQSAVLGLAGENMYNKSLGMHLHDKISYFSVIPIFH